MGSRGLRKDEGIGLGVAIALHAAVLWAILYLKPGESEVVKPPQRIEVTISEEVGMTSTSPNPDAKAAPDKSPELGDPAPEAAPVQPVEPAPAPQPEPRPVPEPAPRAVERPQPKPQPRPEPKPQPKPQPPRPAPKPAPKAPAKPVEKPQPKPQPQAQPKPKPQPKASAKPRPAQKAEPKKPATTDARKSSAIDTIVKSKPKAAPPGKSAGTSKSSTPPKKAGSSAFDDAFKSGTPGARSESGSGAPAAKVGPAQVSALNAAIGRQLKPHWRGKAPEGADAELLVTRVRFRLNRDGSLAGEPQVVSTTGQTDANRAQVSRHQEQAIRAVKLAAPFNLPDDLYEGWKVITTNFDRRLSQ
ncbi:hypothetical protein GR702_12705 [Novosphingobium sp. FGD1]|jgi:outer membrane biosynthesis protein TonB|uniref:Cell envelope biogenesis protein TolA n=1 Tax=Novosphingobium silvae TaxID=2692619 RepID=A0A7X4GH97_9SPHN|nr:hypothetical protein [Novosphingobium silvae]MYL98625.1 hypothetical protein [Novosphingobium silvae]